MLKSEVLKAVTTKIEIPTYIILVINKLVIPANNFDVNILVLEIGFVKRKSAVLKWISLDIIDIPIFIDWIAPHTIIKEKIYA